MVSAMEKTKQEVEERIGNARRSDPLQVSVGSPGRARDGDIYRDLKALRVGAMRKIWGKNFPGRGKSKSVPGGLRHYKSCCGYSDVEGQWYPTSPAKEQSQGHTKPIHSSPNTFVHFKHIFEALLCSRTCYCRAWKSSNRYARPGLCSHGAQILVGK